MTTVINIPAMNSAARLVAIIGRLIGFYMPGYCLRSLGKWPPLHRAFRHTVGIPVAMGRPAGGTLKSTGVSAPYALETNGPRHFFVDSGNRGVPIMYQSLIKYIEDYAQSSLTSQEIARIESAFQPKSLSRKQLFLQAGEVSRYAAFITKGAMRQYCVDENGSEKIVHFYIENHWATDRESFASQKPSLYNIEAWEDTDMLIISREQIQELVRQIPAIADMQRVMDERHAIAVHKRLSVMIVGSAKMRYREFMTNYPHFAQRFPQHHIASYLGITKETLSRIRRQMAG